MAISITVYPELSPRIIEVLSPTTEASVQEIVDACRAWEDMTNNMSYKPLIDAAGKEDLGGGVSVGITATLQNAVIAFEQRGVSDSAGSATTANASGTMLIDSSGTFITDGIQAGDSVLNTTDGSICTITSVDSETQITHFPLEGGTDNDWDSADTYTIWNKVQCEISGGNLVAVNEVGTTISAFLPTALTHVIRTSASSATTQNQSSLEFSSFNAGVAIDVVNGTSGTLFPQGTRQAPVDNFDDVEAISDANGLRKVFVMNDATITTTDFSNESHVFIGDSPHIVLTVEPAADVSSCAMELLTVAGELDGLNTVRSCTLGTVTNVSGFIEKSAFQSTVSINGTTFIAECYSQAPGILYPTITTGSNTLMIRDWHGSLGIAGMTGGIHTIELYGGRLTIEASCTGGTIYMRGSHFNSVDDLSGGAVTLVDQTEAKENADAVWDEDITTHTTADSAGKRLTEAKENAADASLLVPARNP